MFNGYIIKHKIALSHAAEWVVKMHPFIEGESHRLIVREITVWMTTEGKGGKFCGILDRKFDPVSFLSGGHDYE